MTIFLLLIRSFNFSTNEPKYFFHVSSTNCITGTSLIRAVFIKGLKIEFTKSENLPLPLFAKEGYKSSLWQREVRRDFINNVVNIMRPLIRVFPAPQSHEKFFKRKDGHITQSSGTRLKAHTQVTLEFLFLCNCFKRLNILVRNILLCLSLNCCMITKNKIHFKSRGRSPETERFPGYIISMAHEFMHCALYERSGDADGDHSDRLSWQFADAEMYELLRAAGF